MAVAQLRVLGGAMARVPADATAFAHRKSRILAIVAAIYDPTDDKARMKPGSTSLPPPSSRVTMARYVNFVGDEGEARIHDAYPDATWKRLAEIKRRYDPTNLFRLNQNIPPARA